MPRPIANGAVAPRGEIEAWEIETWVRQSARDIHARLVNLQMHDLTDPDDDEVAENLSLKSARSSVYTATGRSHKNKRSHAPSLKSCYTEVTPSENSISTGLASHFTGVPLLEENNGVLLRPQSQVRAPVYECPFWFLSCAFIASDKEEWEVHSLCHFRGEEPPHFITCPLCDWSYQSVDYNGWTAWKKRMQHIAESHSSLGQTLRTSRPDFDLFQHLWSKRLIDNEDLQQLNGGNHNLERPPGNFLVSHRDQRRRDQRHRDQQRSEPPPRETAEERASQSGMEGAARSYRNPASLNISHGDSGYGTLSNPMPSGGQQEGDTMSIRTMLSDASLVFQAPEEREDLISAFVKDLLADAKLKELSDQEQARAISHLSGLLKTFSLRLETGAQSQEERDTKDFIRQQRE